MLKTPPKGERKFRHAQFMALVLLLGFLMAVWMHAEAGLFGSFAGGLSLLSGAFIWGNRAEHQGANGTPAPPAPPIEPPHV